MNALATIVGVMLEYEVPYGPRQFGNDLKVVQEQSRGVMAFRRESILQGLRFAIRQVRSAHVSGGFFHTLGLAATQYSMLRPLLANSFQAVVCWRTLAQSTGTRLSRAILGRLPPDVWIVVESRAFQRKWRRHDQVAGHVLFADLID